MFRGDRFQTDPNGSGPKIVSDRRSVYTGPFWNRSGMDPNGSKTGPAIYKSNFGSVWIRSGPVPERSRLNRSRSSQVRFGTVPVRSGVNEALLSSDSLLILICREIRFLFSPVCFIGPAKQSFFVFLFGGPPFALHWFWLWFSSNHANARGH